MLAFQSRSRRNDYPVKLIHLKEVDSASNHMQSKGLNMKVKVLLF